MTTGELGFMPASRVLLGGHRLKMVRTHAAAVPAQMVKNQPGRDRAVGELISDYVSEGGPSEETHR